MRIEAYGAPVMLTWQLTRDCDLACLHCCTESAPGKALEDELSRDEALGLAAQVVEAQVPYVMLVGGEPTLVPHFFEVAEALGRGGVLLKVETNGQRLTDADAERLSRLPIRSVQVSLDGATQATYAKMRPGASLDRALEACLAVRRFGMPLEVTFAPSRLNLHEAEAVIDLAASLGAFRFNTGALMRLGTAAKLWERLVPSAQDYELFTRLLERKERQLSGILELAFRPFSLSEELRSRGEEPSGTLLVLPDGRVKVAAPLPFVCADLRRQGLREAWAAYREAWGRREVAEGLASVLADESLLAEANRWRELPSRTDLPAVV